MDILSKYGEEWLHAYASNNGGYVEIQRERIREGGLSKSERVKFEKELRMCKVLADNGYRVEYLRGIDRPQGQTYDIRINDIKADLKCVTGGAGNIVKYAKKALEKQGGEAVVFELPSGEPQYYHAITEARRKCKGKILFYIKGEYIVKSI